MDYGRTTALGSQVSDSARVSEHSVELTGLSPNTTYRFRVTSADVAGQLRDLPAAGAAAPATLPDAARRARGRPDLRVRRRQRQRHLRGRQTSPAATARCSSARRSARSSRAPRSPRLDWPLLGRSEARRQLPDGALVARRGRPPTRTPFYDGPRVIEFSATFRPVNDEAVGFGNDLSDFPMAVFSTGNAGMPFQIYAQSGGGPRREQATPLPGVSLNAPASLPDRVERHDRRLLRGRRRSWPPTRSPSTRLMRPAASDYGLFGAGVQVHWLRQGDYAEHRHVHLAAARQRARRGPVADAHRAAHAAQRHADRLRHALRRHVAAGRAAGRRGSPSAPAARSPARPARYIQYRARMTSAHRLRDADARTACRSPSEPEPTGAPVAGHRGRRADRAERRTRRSPPRRAASATPTATR